MKKVLLVLMIGMMGVANPDIKAQTWAQPGATWYYTLHNPIFYHVEGFDKFEKIGDTIKDGKLCDDIYETSYDYNYDLSQWETGHNNYFIYESNDTVFYWDNNFGNNQFNIYAIYSAQVGDTWNFATDTLSCHDSSYFHVDSLGQRIIGIDTLTVWFLTSYNWHDGPPTITPITLTKKLGFNATMFPFSICVTDVYQWGPFRCYSDSSGLSYSSGIVSYCDSTVGIENMSIQDNSISLYPNPTSGTFTISYNSQLSLQNSQLIITDVLGREVYHQAIINPNNTTINISQLSNGVYFYQLSIPNQSGKETLRGKFVKESY